MLSKLKFKMYSNETEENERQKHTYLSILDAENHDKLFHILEPKYIYKSLLYLRCNKQSK